MFSLVAITEFSPPLPGGRRVLERFHEVDRRLDFTLVSVEVEPHIDRLSALQPGRLAVALSQRNARRTSHSRDRAPICVSIEGHLYRGSYLSKHALGVKREWNETHRTFSD